MTGIFQKKNPVNYISQEANLGRLLRRSKFGSRSLNFNYLNINIRLKWDIWVRFYNQAFCNKYLKTNFLGFLLFSIWSIWSWMSLCLNPRGKMRSKFHNQIASWTNRNCGKWHKFERFQDKLPNFISYLSKIRIIATFYDYFFVDHAVLKSHRSNISLKRTVHHVLTCMNHHKATLCSRFNINVNTDIPMTCQKRVLKP